MQIKLNSIRAYKTQFPPSKDRVFQMVTGQNMLAGTSAGFAAGELMFAATTLGVGDLVQAVCGLAQATEKSIREEQAETKPHLTAGTTSEL